MVIANSFGQLIAMDVNKVLPSRILLSYKLCKWGRWIDFNNSMVVSKLVMWRWTAGATK
jgi:hypothetical protein